MIQVIWFLKPTKLYFQSPLFFQGLFIFTNKNKMTDKKQTRKEEYGLGGVDWLLVLIGFMFIFMLILYAKNIEQIVDFWRSFR